MESEVLKELCRFYDDSKEWITDYSNYAIKFNTEMVERKLSFSDLDGMLEDYTVLILTANPIEQNILTCKLYQEMNADVSDKEKLSEICAGGCVYQFATIRNINIVHRMLISGNRNLHRPNSFLSCGKKRYLGLQAYISFCFYFLQYLIAI